MTGTGLKVNGNTMLLIRITVVLLSLGKITTGAIIKRSPTPRHSPHAGCITRRDRHSPGKGACLELVEGEKAVPGGRGRTGGSPHGGRRPPTEGFVLWVEVAVRRGPTAVPAPRGLSSFPGGAATASAGSGGSAPAPAPAPDGTGRAAGEAPPPPAPSPRASPVPFARGDAVEPGLAPLHLPTLSW